MRSSYVKFILMTTISLIPLCGNTTTPTADNSAPQESFQTTCVNSWMKRMDNIKDKVDYQNFGEKYCECAARHPLDTQEAVNKTMQLCMSQTLLQDTMDALENEVGLDKATDDDVNEYCKDRFTLVFPKMSDKDIEASVTYCSCAQPKLKSLLKIADNLTDKEYSDKINEIAAVCSSGGQDNNQTSTSTTTQSQTSGTDEKDEE